MAYFSLSLRVPLLMVLFLALTFGGASLVQAAPTAAEYGVILNLSGKQRMLSQKMSKEIMLVALDVSASENLDNLGATSALFDKTLKGLKDGDSSLGLPPTESKRIRRQLDKVSAIWTTFYPVVQQVISAKSVTPEQIQIIAEQSPLLLKDMNKAVGLYEKDAKKSGLEAAPGLAAQLNLSGKQRMLSQKMSKEYLLIALGHEVDINKLNLLETYSLFDRTLTGLSKGDETLGLPVTTQGPILKQLAAVEALWIDFKPFMEQGADHKTQQMTAEQIQRVAQSNLPLLAEMNAAVTLYETEAAK